MTTGNKIVDEVTKMRITGNTIPHNWYKTITRPNGKPYLNAIVILSDIVYWYRATEIRDENTNYVVGIKKKFSAPDFLQRDYGQLSKFFGISKEETRNAMEHLEKIGVIKKHLRTIENNGRKVPNVLYVELIPKKLYELTYSVSGGMGLKTDICGSENQYIPGLETDIHRFETGCDMCSKTDTNTENTNVNFPKNSQCNKGALKNQPGEMHIEIINYLNQKTGKRFRADTVETVKLISHLINRGYTVDDFRKVIDFKCVEWIGNSYMEPKLRPSTLFAESNFESYVQQDAPIPQKGATYGRQNNTFVDNSSTGGVQAPSY